ncbi:MAG: hypothetical protein ACXVFK_17990 [Solirubrobacteraceae bacterium]
MTSRDRIVVIVVAAAALLAGFWFVVLSPKRAEVKAVDAQIASAQQRLDAARASVSQAQQAKRDYDTDYAAVARLGKAVPVDDNIPSLVYQLQSVSRNAKVDFRSFKLDGTGTPAPTTPAAATASAASSASSGSSSSGSSGSSSSSSSSSSTTSTAPAPATQLAVAALPPGASVGPAGFPTMPFTFVFDGSFFDMEHMLRNIDQFISVRKDAVSVHGRLLGVDGFALTAGPTGFPSVTATLSATAYLLPADEGLTAGATVSGPATAAGAAGASTAKTASTAGGTPAPPTAAAAGVTP